MNALRPLLARVDALTPRERVILFVLMLAAIWMLFDVAVFKPQKRAYGAQQSRLQQGQADLVKAQELLAQRIAQPDPEAAARQRLAQARKALDERVKQTQNLQQRLVSPKDMVKVLEVLLANQPNLHLLSLRTLAPVPLGQAAAKPGDATPGVALYKHGVTLVVSGSYEGLTRYMERLERLPAGFYWERASLDASRHPALALTLTVNTLSQEKTWLSL